MNHGAPDGGSADSRPGPLLDRRRLVVVAVTTCVASLIGVWMGNDKEDKHDPGPRENIPAEPGAPQVVSLSPGVTQTLIHLGVQDAIVGISDYCEPPEGVAVTQVGSALTPNYEKIAQLTPTLIVTSDVKGEQLAPLEKLAPTLSLPWLTLEQLTGSIEELGNVVDRKASAKKLSATLTRRLGVRPPKSGPRILFALDYGESGMSDVWFIRQNSIHGAVLHAAGANNAVSQDVEGPPKLSPEGLVELDPDGILILRTKGPGPAEERSMAAFSKYKPLQAVKKGRIATLSIPGALTVGPAVLDLIPIVEAKLKTMMAQGDDE